MCTRTKVLNWHYVCDQCGQTGSAKVEATESALNSVHKVFEAHAAFNPRCGAEYQGRWIRIWKVNVAK